MSTVAKQPHPDAILDPVDRITQNSMKPNSAADRCAFAADRDRFGRLKRYRKPTDQRLVSEQFKPKF